MPVIFKDQGEGVVMVKHLNIWYFWKALNALYKSSRLKDALCNIKDDLQIEMQYNKHSYIFRGV